MTDPLPPELAVLPAPELIEETAFEILFDAARADLRARLLAADFPVDTLDLAHEPVALVLGSTSTENLRLRQRVNEAYRGNLLAFARAGGLDHLAAWSNVFRLAGEADASMRRRVVVANQARESAGTEPRYRHIALAASPRVKDAAVYTIGKDPRVHVAVISADNGGVADAGLLALVQAALLNRAKRTINDIVVVEAAVSQIVPVTAQLWLEPDASESVIETTRAGLVAAWTPTLGRDLTRDWLTARLMAPGVHRIAITAPPADVVAAPRQAIALGAVTLTLAGRDY